MRKILMILMCCLLLCGCEKPNSKMPDLAAKTSSVAGKFGVQLEKHPLRMLNIDGTLYYDANLLSDIKVRCGVMDWALRKTVEIGEVPRESGTANFDCEGCQFATAITCEVLLDGEWRIFKKFENQTGETKDLTGFPYCFYIKGRLNNAEIDNELAVLTDDKDITFSDVFEPMLSSQYLPDTLQKAISFDYVQSGDPWGISCYVKDLTNHSMTFQIEQFDGSYEGQLQTGEWFQIYQRKEDEWEALPTNPLIDYAFASVAYPIAKNDITEFEIEWEWLYGELEPGDYRLDKEVMDFVVAGDFEKEIYSVTFHIDE